MASLISRPGKAINPSPPSAGVWKTFPPDTKSFSLHEKEGGGALCITPLKTKSNDKGPGSQMNRPISSHCLLHVRTERSDRYVVPSVRRMDFSGRDRGFHGSLARIVPRVPRLLPNRWEFVQKLSDAGTDIIARGQTRVGCATPQSEPEALRPDPAATASGTCRSTRHHRHTWNARSARPRLPRVRLDCLSGSPGLP